jgi:plastocyanin
MTHIMGQITSKEGRETVIIRTWMSAGAAVVVAAAALMTGALVLHQTAGQASAKEIEVEVGDNFFQPKTMTVNVGDTVVWKVEGTMGHTVTSDTGVFDSGQDPLTQGDTFSFTFTQPGTYPYYCRFHGGPGGVGMSGTVVVEAAGQPTPAPAAPTPTTAPAPTASAPTPSGGSSGGATGQSITVNLGPGRDASQPGTAVLTAQGNQTMVTIDIAPGAAGVPQPVHIHEGTCANLGAVKYPLTNIVDGKSTTMVNVALKDLQTGGFAINAHKSQAEINVYVACGNIPASTTSTAPARLPAAGTGGYLSGGGGISPWWYALAAGGGLLLVGGSYGLWRARARR